MHYRTCPDCGAHIDHGERCDCKEMETAPRQRKRPPGKITKPSVAAPAPEVKIARGGSGGY